MSVTLSLSAWICPTTCAATVQLQDIGDVAAAAITLLLTGVLIVDLNAATMRIGE